MSKGKPELGGLDAFQLYALRVGRWGKANSKQIAIVVLPIIVLVIGILIGRSYLKTQKDNRLVAIASIDSVYELEEKELATRRQALQQQIDQLSKQTKKPPTDDKIENLRTQIDTLKADHREVFEQYRSFFDDNRQTAEGWAAAVRAVGIALVDKKYREAQQLLAELLPQVSENDFYRDQARLLYIRVLEQLGEIDKALVEIDNGYQQLPDRFKAQLLLIKGRLQLAQQRKSEAIATYDQIIEDFADSRAALRAKSIKLVID